MSARSVTVGDLVRAARMLGLDAGWNREFRASASPQVSSVDVRAWVDGYEASDAIELTPAGRPDAVQRRAKLLLNHCLMARGAMNAVYELAVRGATDSVIPAAGSRAPDSRPTARHQQLLAQPAQSSAGYSERALHACLQSLLPKTRWRGVYRRGVGGPIEPTITTRTLQVHDAWVQDGWSFAITYDYAEHQGCLGFRACVLDHTRPGRYEWMYGGNLAEPPDPVTWGNETAMLDILEPLGTVAGHLRYDRDGTGWWGEEPHQRHS